jgi:purine-nucleoside phosphorylase
MKPDQHIFNMNISRPQMQNYFFGDQSCIADKILFIKRPTRLNEYKECLTNTYEFGNVWQGITGSFHGQRMTIIVTGIGPTMVGDAVYALDRPNSVCLYSGTCGGLHPDLQIGDYFVAHQAMCGDGFSFLLGHSPLAAVSGHSNVLASLASLIGNQADHVFEGTTFTTSSVVREADIDFWEVVDPKCWAIEMAAASLYTAAAATHKKAAAYFWVSDLPIRGKSFFEEPDPADVQSKQNRYDQTVGFDLELLAAL